MYAADPARVVAAAAITGAANAGRDVPALLARVVNKRAWEDDQDSAARSIAGVLAYRIERDLVARARRRPPAPVPASAAFSADITTRSRTPRTTAATAFDAHLKNLLGERQWRQYAEDPRRCRCRGPDHPGSDRRPGRAGLAVCGGHQAKSNTTPSRLPAASRACCPTG